MSSPKSSDFPEQFRLMQASIFFRHGARTPLRDRLVNIQDWMQFPCSEAFEFEKALSGYESSAQPCIGGQLTTLGKNQLFELGQQMRERYINKLGLLNDELKLDQIVSRSTGLKRTQESATSFLLGLYPASKRAGLDIPVFKKEREDENMYVVKCPRLLHLFTMHHHSPAYLARRAAFQQTLPKELDRYLAEKDDKGGDVTYFGLFDTFTSMAAHSHPLPFKPAHLETLTRMAESEWWDTFSDPQVVRLGIGRFLTEMRQPLETMARTGKGPKFLVYSGHDSTLVPLMAAFKTYQGWPPFASHIELELFEEKAQPQKKGKEAVKEKPEIEGAPGPLANKFVRIRYNDQVQELPACIPDSKVPGFCPLETFFSILQPLQTDAEQFEKECACSDSIEKIESNL